MERLTKKNDSGGYYYPKCFEKCNGLGASSKCDNCEITTSVCEKLGEFEDLEEQGRLIKLPCKVGDKLYYTDSYCNTVISVRLNEVIIQFVGINNYAYQYNCCSFDECGDVYEEYEFDNNDFGKTVFLTKSEAEAKLKELRGGENVKTS